MATLGSGILPQLGVRDYSAYNSIAQSKLAGAQSLAQGISSLGSSIAGGIKDYQTQKTLTSQKLQEANAGKTIFKDNPEMLGVFEDLSKRLGDQNTPLRDRFSLAASMPGVLEMYQLKESSANARLNAQTQAKYASLRPANAARDPLDLLASKEFVNERLANENYFGGTSKAATVGNPQEGTPDLNANPENFSAPAPTGLPAGADSPEPSADLLPPLGSLTAKESANPGGYPAAEPYFAYQSEAGASPQMDTEPPKARPVAETTSAIDRLLEGFVPGSPAHSETVPVISGIEEVLGMGASGDKYKRGINALNAAKQRGDSKGFQAALKGIDSMITIDRNRYSNAEEVISINVPGGQQQVVRNKVTGAMRPLVEPKPAPPEAMGPPAPGTRPEPPPAPETPIGFKSDMSKKEQMDLQKAEQEKVDAEKSRNRVLTTIDKFMSPRGEATEALDDAVGYGEIVGTAVGRTPWLPGGNKPKTIANQKQLKLDLLEKSILEASKSLKPVSNDELAMLQANRPQITDPPEVWVEYMKSIKDLLGNKDNFMQPGEADIRTNEATLLQQRIREQNAKQK